MKSSIGSQAGTPGYHSGDGRPPLDTPYQGNIIAAKPGSKGSRITMYNARVTVRDAEGKMILLTGNMIGSILAYYRTSRMMVYANYAFTDATYSFPVTIRP